MSVMGSQLEIDMDPDGDLTVVPRHTGQTGTGCYRLHDHQIYEPAIHRLGPVYANLPAGSGEEPEGGSGAQGPDAFFLESSAAGSPYSGHKGSRVGGPTTGNGDASWSGTGPGPPPYGASQQQQQQHLLDMPLQPPTPTAAARQRAAAAAAKQLNNAQGQRPMVSRTE